jgi:hypothetical protein
MAHVIFCSDPRPVFKKSAKRNGYTPPTIKKLKKIKNFLKKYCIIYLFMLLLLHQRKITSV